jgi:signal peptidase II
MNASRARTVFILTALICVGLDQLSKAYVFSFEPGEVFALGEIFKIEHAMNTGAVFGIGEGNNPLFAVVSAAFLVAMIPFFFARIINTGANALIVISCGFAYGGVLGNYIDRITIGYVRDFIGVWIWPTFNVADSFICIGVLIIACSIIFGNLLDDPKEPADGRS